MASIIKSNMVATLKIKFLPYIQYPGKRYSLTLLCCYVWLFFYLLLPGLGKNELFLWFCVINSTKP